MLKWLSYFFSDKGKVADLSETLVICNVNDTVTVALQVDCVQYVIEIRSE